MYIHFVHLKMQNNMKLIFELCRHILECITTRYHIGLWCCVECKRQCNAQYVFLNPFNLCNFTKFKREHRVRKVGCIGFAGHFAQFVCINIHTEKKADGNVVLYGFLLLVFFLSLWNIRKHELKSASIGK